MLSTIFYIEIWDLENNKCILFILCLSLYVFLSTLSSATECPSFMTSWLWTYFLFWANWKNEILIYRASFVATVAFIEYLWGPKKVNAITLTSIYKTHHFASKPISLNWYIVVICCEPNRQLVYYHKKTTYSSTTLGCSGNCHTKTKKKNILNLKTCFLNDTRIGHYT